MRRLDSKLFPLLLFGVFFFQLFQLLFRSHLRQRAHAVDDHRAVEVVEFVLPDSGDVSALCVGEGMAFQVLGVDAHGFGAHDLGVDLGQAQAAFFAFLFAAVGFGEDGVDVDAVVARLAGGVGDEETDVFAHLRGGQSDPFGAAHQLEHLGGQRRQAIVKLGDGFAHLAESGVGIMNDLEVFEHRFVR
jgi:hypothetical protein